MAWPSWWGSETMRSSWSRKVVKPSSSSMWTSYALWSQTRRVITVTTFSNSGWISKRSITVSSRHSTLPMIKRKLTGRPSALRILQTDIKSRDTSKRYSSRNGFTSSWTKHSSNVWSKSLKRWDSWSSIL